MSATDEVLSSLDELFLEIETPHQLMTISAVYLFDSPLSRDAVKEEFERFVTNYPRYKKRVSQGNRHPKVWETYDFNLDDHIEEIQLSKPGNQQQLEELTSNLLSQPFNPTKALWKTTLIQGLESGGCALLTRIHHCITDGQGSVRSILSLMKPVDNKESLQHVGTTNRFNQQEKNIFQKVLRFPMFILFWIFSLIEMFLRGMYVTLYQNKAFVPHKHHQTKKTSWTEISLAEVKTIKNHFKCTVNDLLLAILTGAIRNYILRQNLPFEKEILCGIPVSLRKKDDWSLTNKSVSLWVWLPSGITDPAKRIEIIRNRMQARKQSPEAQLSLLSLDSMLRLSGVLGLTNKMASIFHWYMDKYHVIMTNVPGPASLLTFANSTISSYVGIIPQPGAKGFGITIMSYDTKIGFSVLADEGIDPTGPSPSKILVEEFQKEFEAYRDLVPRE